MRSILTWALLAAAACSGTSDDSPAPAGEAPAVLHEVTVAVTVARRISANPTAADSILKANGLTRGGLDSLLYTIAADSVKSARYNAARP